MYKPLCDASDNVMLSVVATLLQVLPVGSLEIKVKAAPSQKVAMSIATFTVMPCALKSASVLFTLIGISTEAESVYS